VNAGTANIALSQLKELWLNTGTACNLSCPFCHEGSSPGDSRLPALGYELACQTIDAAMDLGVERFAFTGGEPLILRDIQRILLYALARRPCLVLTNGTAPMIRRTQHLAQLRSATHPLSFRVSIDYADEAAHDAAGPGDVDHEPAAALEVLAGDDHPAGETGHRLHRDDHGHDARGPPDERALVVGRRGHVGLAVGGDRRAIRPRQVQRDAGAGGRAGLARRIAA